MSGGQPVSSVRSVSPAPRRTSQPGATGRASAPACREMRPHAYGGESPPGHDAGMYVNRSPSGHDRSLAASAYELQRAAGNLQKHAASLGSCRDALEPSKIAARCLVEECSDRLAIRLSRSASSCASGRTNTSGERTDTSSIAMRPTSPPDRVIRSNVQRRATSSSPPGRRFHFEADPRDDLGDLVASGKIARLLPAPEDPHAAFVDRDRRGPRAPPTLRTNTQPIIAPSTAARSPRSSERKASAVRPDRLGDCCETRRR